MDPKRTSPYEFYQFWLNAGDADAGTYIRIFTLKTREEIEALEAQHKEAPHLRVLQKALADDITTRVHGEAELKLAIAASEVLFGKGTIDQLAAFSDEQFVSVFQGAGVPVFETSADSIAQGISIVELTKNAGLTTSNGEAIKLIKGNGLALNKVKVSDQQMIVNQASLINGKYILLQKGKKDYCLVKAG